MIQTFEVDLASSNRGQRVISNGLLLFLRKRFCLRQTTSLGLFLVVAPITSWLSLLTSGTMGNPSKTVSVVTVSVLGAKEVRCIRFLALSSLWFAKRFIVS